MFPPPPLLFFIPLFTHLFICWNKSFFQFSQIERGHYETNGWPSILFVTNSSNYDPINFPGVFLPNKVNHSISKVWNTHDAETNVDNKTRVNYSLTRMSTLARLHTPAIYASAVMKASKYAIKPPWRFKCKGNSDSLNVHRPPPSVLRVWYMVNYRMNKQQAIATMLMTITTKVTFVQ